MHIKHFTMNGQRVPDPLRPGRTAIVGRLTESGNTSLSHDGTEYEPDENGWINVPHEVGLDLIKFRDKGSGFYTPGDVVDQVRLGALEDADQPVAVKAPAKKAAEAKSAPPAKETRAEKKAREDTEAAAETEQTARAEGWRAMGIDEAEWRRDEEGNLLDPPAAE
jgi:hypothetical protein